MSDVESAKEDFSFDTIKVELDQGIAWVTLNRPEKRNAMSPTLNREMLAALDRLEIEPSCGVVILTGAGESFSAGMDLKEYFRESEEEGLAGVRKSQAEAYRWWRKLRWYQKPTIAMINGWCFGGGYAPLFACDLAIAADEAKFGLSEVNWGILPGGGASKVAVDLLSMRDAMYHAMTGEPIDGPTAAAWRLVNESVPLTQLEERVTALANKLLEKNPVALKATKDAIRRVKEMTFDNAEDYLIRAQEAAFHFDRDGSKAGIRQFIDEKSYKPGLGAYDKARA